MKKQKKPSMKLIPGYNFLKPHEQDTKHVLISRVDWAIVVEFLSAHPELVTEAYDYHKKRQQFINLLPGAQKVSLAGEQI